MNSSVERNLSFCGSTYIVPFFEYFFNVSFYGIPGIYYVCNFLLCPIFSLNKNNMNGTKSDEKKTLNNLCYYIRLYFTVFLLARSNTRDIPFSNIFISKKQFLCNK
jgi:hypothetical protein